METESVCSRLVAGNPGAGMRRAARSDANQRAIIAALRAAGVRVAVTSRLGDGCPDILTLYRGRWLPIEIKTARGVLTPEEWLWWQRMGADPVIVRSVEDALMVVGVETW